MLAEIGADQVPQILVRNKMRRRRCEPGVERDEYGKIRAVRLSALTGAGVPELRAALAERFPAPRGPGGDRTEKRRRSDYTTYLHAE